MFTLRIADHSFCIDNRYGYIEKMCTDYIIPDCNAQIISVTDDEIKREENTDIKYSDDYLESLAVYRKICEVLTDDNIILFHCSAIMIDDMAVLFTAPSGTGKSTHARLWKKHFGNKVKVINDDKPLIRFDKDGAFVYGTPWCGKHGLQTNTSARIDAVFILEQSTQNEIIKPDFFDAYTTMLSQTYRPDDTGKMRKIMPLVNRFISGVKYFRLKCNMSEDAAVTAYNAMKGLKS